MKNFLNDRIHFYLYKSLKNNRKMLFLVDSFLFLSIISVTLNSLRPLFLYHFQADQKIIFRIYLKICFRIGNEILVRREFFSSKQFSSD